MLFELVEKKQVRAHGSAQHVEPREHQCQVVTSEPFYSTSSGSRLIDSCIDVFVDLQLILNLLVSRHHTPVGALALDPVHVATLAQFLVIQDHVHLAK